MGYVYRKADVIEGLNRAGCKVLLSEACDRYDIQEAMETLTFPQANSFWSFLQPKSIRMAEPLARIGASNPDSKKERLKVGDSSIESLINKTCSIRMAFVGRAKFIDGRLKITNDSLMPALHKLLDERHGGLQEGDEISVRLIVKRNGKILK